MLSRLGGISALAVLPLLWLQPVFALEIKPSIEAGVAYTDNLTLAPKGEELDDWVYRVMPLVNITHQSRRVDLNVDYAYSYLKYQDTTDESSSFNDLNAILNLELVDETFFLDTWARIDQQLTDPDGVVFFTNIPLVENRTDATRLQTAPVYRKEMLGHLLDTRYTIGQVNYDSPDVQDVTFQTVEATFSPDERPSGFGWGLTYNYARFEYDSPPLSKFQEAFTTLIYDFNEDDDFEIYADIGGESDVEKISSSNIEEFLWEVGVRRRTPKTLIELGFGDRSFGSTARVLIERRMNENIINISYNESPQLQESLFNDRNANELAGIPNVPDTIDRPGSNVRFVLKRFQASFVRETERNTFSLLGFHEDQDNLPVLGGDPGDPEVVNPGADKQYGYTIEWEHRFGSRTTGRVSGGWVDRTFESGNGDEIIRFLLEGEYALGTKTSLRGWYSFTKQHDPTITSDNYTENQVGLTLRYDIL